MFVPVSIWMKVTRITVGGARLCWNCLLWQVIRIYCHCVLIILGGRIHNYKNDWIAYLLFEDHCLRASPSSSYLGGRSPSGDLVTPGSRPPGLWRMMSRTRDSTSCRDTFKSKQMMFYGSIHFSDFLPRLVWGGPS